MITQARLRELLTYDPATGVFTWNVPRKNQVRAGDVAGHNSIQGYVLLVVDGQHVFAHKAVWLYVYGALPDAKCGQFIDHKNRKRDDNRLDNLALVSRTENNCNRSVCDTTGTAYVSHLKKWKAQIRLDGKKIHIGVFNSRAEAHEAYMVVKRAHHYFIENEEH